jgi:predicted dehydrogenase
MVLEVSSRFDGYRREIRLVCTEGTAILSDGYAADILVIRTPPGSNLANAPEERRPIVNDLPLLSELRAFVDHLAGGPPPRSSAADAAAIVETVATLRELARTPSPELSATSGR